LIEQAAGRRRAARSEFSPPSATCCVCREPKRTCFRSERPGGDVRIVFSPLDAVKIAEKIQPGRSFSSRWFRDHGPGHALGRVAGGERGLGNFSLLVSHVLVPRPWMPSCVLRKTACRLSPRTRLCPDGVEEYKPIAAEYRVQSSYQPDSSPGSASGHIDVRAAVGGKNRRRWRISTRGRCARKAKAAQRSRRSARVRVVERRWAPALGHSAEWSALSEEFRPSPRRITL